MTINETMQTIVYAVVALVVLAILGYLAYQAIRMKTGTSAQQQAARDNLKRARELMQPILMAMVTRAEREFGAGTGVLKLGTVVEWATDWAGKYLPEGLRSLIDVGWVTDQIENALADAKKKWAANPALVPDQQKAGDNNA